MITLTEKTYVVKDSAYTRKFVDGANGITIPGTHGNGLHFSDSKKGMVKSFYKALGEFLDEIERGVVCEEETGPVGITRFKPYEKGNEVLT